MSSLIETILQDIANSGGPRSGYLLEEVRRTLQRSLTLEDEEAALDAAYMAMEGLFDRVARYQEELQHQQVPAHEDERHQRLLGAFDDYGAGLSALLDALIEEPACYRPSLLLKLKNADEVLSRHREAAQQSRTITAIL